MAEPIQIGEGRDGSRRVLVLAAVAAAILLGVVVLPGLLFSDSSSPSTEEAFGSIDQGVTATTVAPSGPEPAETFEVFSSTNPFHPLVDTTPITTDAPVGESTPVLEIDEDTPTPTLPPFAEDDGSFTFPEDGDGGEEPPATTTTSPPPARQPDRVSLLEVFTDPGGQVVASVRVNDVTHQVTDGDVFATSYRVVDLDIGTRCGTFLFGDERFGLCEGDEVLV